uniref:Arc family DNA-binding protein n=1 Tax=Aeromonas caviae TaxID=648 RepID=UPI003F742F96
LHAETALGTGRMTSTFECSKKWGDYRFVNVCFDVRQTLERRGFLVKVTRETKQTKFRIPEEMLTYLKEQAEKNFRSVNAELMARLVRTMEQDVNGEIQNEGKLA